MTLTAVGFVMAGGRSQRMGRDKALLPWGSGSTLLDHALARMRAACPDTRILSGAEVRYADRGVPVHEDLVRDAGPLAGVHAGLSVLPEGWGVFLAVDMPFVPTAVLRALIGWAEGHDAAVPVVDGLTEPLCAVYDRRCLASIQKSLAAGELKMTSFWPSVRVRTVAEDELAAFGEPRRLFRNVNRPEDYDRAAAEGG